jgi:hypothetical protein
MERFKINDLVGSPTTYVYHRFGRISPSTLRYVKVASDLRRLFGDLTGAKVAEIGVGYGGQLLVLDQIFTHVEVAEGIPHHEQRDPEEHVHQGSSPR